MISSYTAYRAGLARIDDLHRQGAEWRRGSEMSTRPDVSGSKALSRQPRPKLSLRGVPRTARPRSAAGE